ncbi:ArsR/SmtB family transcription factor [Agaribacterium sp. ZY112]|uniref:ArsR/SmtB family transcription factor n=1 Tax=Agaribacterium sp. ZY112 TaxID=3233574 RepID=UPI0035259554
MTNKDLEQLAVHASDATALLKEMANEKRLMIFCCLGDGEMSVSQLNELVPLSQSALSQHLARLREAGFLSTRREAQTIYYRVANNNVGKIIHTLKSIYCPD